MVQFIVFLLRIVFSIVGFILLGGLGTLTAITFGQARFIDIAEDYVKQIWKGF